MHIDVAASGSYVLRQRNVVHRRSRGWGARALWPDSHHVLSSRLYQGWFAGPTVNSFTVVSSGWSMAKATMLAMRSGEMPYLS